MFISDNDIDVREAKALIEGEKLGILDRIFGRLISRKFFVFLTATGLLAYNFLDPDRYDLHRWPNCY